MVRPLARAYGSEELCTECKLVQAKQLVSCGHGPFMWYRVPQSPSARARRPVDATDHRIDNPMRPRKPRTALDLQAAVAVL